MLNTFRRRGSLSFSTLMFLDDSPDGSAYPHVVDGGVMLEGKWLTLVMWRRARSTYYLAGLASMPKRFTPIFTFS